jgi:predicted Zn-dependent protease
MLTRDEALTICETVLSHAKAAGADDAVVALENSIESHARFADNRITTSGRAEDLDVTATVWVEQRRGAATGNDPGAEALERLAQEAVQIARVSPVHREYVPTLGPLTYPESRGFAPATADVDLTARAEALQGALAACRAAEVTGAGFHTANAVATAAATLNGNRRYFRASEAAFSVTARSDDGTGSGYFAGDHFDLARLDARHIAAQAVDKAVRSRQPKAIEPGTYPVILEPQAVADLMGFLTGGFDARTADEGRSACQAKAARRGWAKRCSTSDSACTATRCTRSCPPFRQQQKASRPHGCHSSEPACSTTSSIPGIGHNKPSATRPPARSTSSSRVPSRRR